MKPCWIPLTTLFLLTIQAAAKVLPDFVSVREASVNEITISGGGKKLAVNFSKENSDTLLLTHARRDIVEAARRTGANQVIAHASSREFLEGTRDHWDSWWEKRFDYYGQQVTERPTRDFAADRYLDEQSEFTWEDLSFEVIPTPGYTRDGVTYLLEHEGTRIAFVGDLILAGGLLRDLYSFQNEIPDAKVGAYHGHLGRLATWLDSVDALSAQNPDILVPSRGPVSTNAREDLDKAAESARKIYRNYLFTNALHWYFGEERMNTCAERVLGSNHGVTSMPLAEHIDLPAWCQHIGTTKLLISETGSGFALDVGGQRALDSLLKAREDGLLGKLDGIFATHTHNDHTAAIAAAAEEFKAPVYAIPEVADVLENPGNWFLPGISPHAVPGVTTVEDGHVMRWEEFKLTYRFFPGQMYNHGALLVEKEGHDPVFFIGDSFSPSGIDDYCLMNRNLMREDTGYELCFRIIESLPASTWLVNQHIPHLFRFTEKERSFLLDSYRERGRMISGITPWDDLNYAIDEQWAHIYPYGQDSDGNGEVSAELRIWNHSREPRGYRATLQRNGETLARTETLSIGARETGRIPFTVSADSLASGINVITASIIRDDGTEALEFCEMLVRVGAPGNPAAKAE